MAMRDLATALVLGLSVVGCHAAPPPPAAGTDATAGSQALSADTHALSGTSSASTTQAETAPGGVESLHPLREVTIPAGTSLPILLDTPVASDTSRVEQPVRGHLSRAITVDGLEVLPKGSAVNGVITEAVRAGKTKGRARLSLRFDALEPAGGEERYSLDTSEIERIAPSEKKKDAAKIAVPAVGGAIIGGIVGGGKGAAIGGAVGGGAGTAVVMTDRGQEVRFGKGAALTVKLTRPLVVRVRS